MAIIGNEDHKQRVNLSNLAQSVIEIDQASFDEGSSLSGFLNRIITAFRDTAEASIDLTVKERQQKLLMDGYAPDIAARLADEHRKHLLQKKQSYPMGDSLIFRLNNYNFDMLYEKREESTAYSAPSKYLKALLEEYARLSPSERERVYYAPLIHQQLEPALEGGYLLEIRVGRKAYFMKPYCLMADPFNSHLYLVGITCRADKPFDQQAIASFRITRLSNVKLKKQRNRLTADEKREIEKQLQQVGVQYLVGNQDHIKVRLTPAGRRAFLQRSYMRPTPEKIEGDVYHFDCTPMQIRNFFMSFGKDAEILEPESLRQQFCQFYREAAQLYE